MLPLLIEGLDYLLFALVAMGGLVLAHVALRRSRLRRGLPAGIWGLSAVLLMVGWFIVEAAGNSERRHLKSVLEGFAPTYAQETELMGHARLATEPDPEDPLYLAMIEAQIRWLRVNPSLADIYTFRRLPDGSVVLVVDSETDYDHNGRYEGEREARTLPGERYEESDPELDRAFEGHLVFAADPVTDRWGTWVSAYAPLRDADGRVEAVLGVDYSAPKWQAAIAWSRTRALGVLGALEFILVASAAIIALLRSEIRDRRAAEARLEAHGEHLEKLVEERSMSVLDAQRQLLQQEKLASVGQLAAGVAHEINTPIQYVGDNLRALSDAFEHLVEILQQYRSLVESADSAPLPSQAVEDIRRAESERDLEYLLEDIPNAVRQALEGVGRVTKIVRAMKDFSHMDRGEFAPVDLNRSLEDTLTVARNEYKYVADVRTEFEELPPVVCCGGELNQVFLNLLVNAAHAIADTKQHGLITISTRRDADQVIVSISDSGTGIPPEIQSKIFDPFFTTKEVGRGTGQGLSIAHQIVVGRHKGSLTFETQPGKGTTFRIRIPIGNPDSTETADVDEEAHPVCG
jgi:signal transduction histidine kinase